MIGVEVVAVAVAGAVVTAVEVDAAVGGAVDIYKFCRNRGKKINVFYADGAFVTSAACARRTSFINPYASSNCLLLRAPVMIILPV